MSLPKINDNEVLKYVPLLCVTAVSCYSGVIPVQGPITLGHKIAGDKEEVSENVKISKR
jgi:hypothetical protein